MYFHPWVMDDNIQSFWLAHCHFSMKKLWERASWAVMRVVGFGSSRHFNRSTADPGISGHCLVGLVECFSPPDSGVARNLWHRLLRSRGRVTGRQVSSLSEYRWEKQVMVKFTCNTCPSNLFLNTKREGERDKERDRGKIYSNALTKCASSSSASTP